MVFVVGLTGCKSEGETSVKKTEPALIIIGDNKFRFCSDEQVASDPRALDLNGLTSVDFSDIQQLASGQGYEMHEVPHKFVDNKISDEWRKGNCNIKSPPKGSKEYSFITTDIPDSDGLAYYVSVTPEQRIWSVVSSTNVSLEGLIGGPFKKPSKE